MRVSYTDGYQMPLPPKHPFPMGKYSALHRILLTEGLIRPQDVVTPEPAGWADLLLVHTPAYLQGLAAGTLGKLAVRRIGLPWSERLVLRARLAAQGTINAALMAIEDGIAGNLAGGTHHAYPGHGEGYCTLNDVAVAIRTLQRSGWIRRALVVDLDVHQGNGTAVIFHGDQTVFTFSMHGEKNYPFHKPPSSLDIGLPDGTDDAAYLDTLSRNLPGVIERADPDLIFYLAGVDVLQGDRYGRLKLTREGLHARDRYVLETLKGTGLPVTLVLSGGYAATHELTADLHAVAYREARRVYADV